MNEQLLAKSGADVLSSRRKLRQTVVRWHLTPLPSPVHPKVKLGRRQRVRENYSL